MSDSESTPARADAPPANLIAAFIATRPGVTQQALCTELEMATGQAYSPQRLLQWRRGDRPTPEPVQRHMRAQVLRAHMPTRKAQEWERMLEPPPLRQRPERPRNQNPIKKPSGVEAAQGAG